MAKRKATPTEAQLPTLAMLKAREYLAQQIELRPSSFPEGVDWTGDDPDDYEVFVVIDDYAALGGNRYVAVHRVTGEVLALAMIGE